MVKFTQPRCEHCGTKDNCLFNVCSKDELSEISASKSCNVYKKGQVVFQEGSLPLGMFCLHKGLVKITKLGSNGKEQILRIAKAGDFLGYRSLIGGSRYRASAVALEDTTICLVPKAEFMETLRANSVFHDGMMKVLCTVIESAENKLTDIAYKPVRGRIAEALILLDKAFDDREQITLTREDLAGFVGTVKETAIRIVSEFKNEKLIEIDKRSIKVVNPEGLMRISNLYD